MSVYVQETDSGVVFHLAERVGVPLEVRSETWGGVRMQGFVALVGASELVGDAWAFVRRLGDSSIAEEARRLLLTVQDIIHTLEELRFEVSVLPPLNAFLVDDGSVLIEWIFPEFRIGFSLEPDHTDSSWYLASSEELGEIGAYGYLYGINLNKLIMWLISFALSYS